MMGLCVSKRDIFPVSLTELWKRSFQETLFLFYMGFRLSYWKNLKGGLKVPNCFFQHFRCKPSWNIYCNFFEEIPLLRYCFQPSVVGIRVAVDVGAVWFYVEQRGTVNHVSAREIDFVAFDSLQPDDGHPDTIGPPRTANGKNTFRSMMPGRYLD